jgi:hypothetical protein
VYGVREGANGYGYADNGPRHGHPGADCHADACPGCPNVAAGDPADDATTATHRDVHACAMHAYPRAAANCDVATDPVPNVYADTGTLPVEVAPIA